MAVYLVQHGLSLPKDEALERGLSETGITDVKGGIKGDKRGDKRDVHNFISLKETDSNIEGQKV